MKSIITHSGYPNSKILTADGWKWLSEIMPGDKVMTIAPDGKTITYTAAINCQAAVGQLDIAFVNTRLNLTVSQDQPIFVLHNQKGVPTPTMIAARDLKCADKLPMTGYQWHGKDEPYFILPAIEKKVNQHKTVIVPEKKIDMKAWLEFFGFWLADGCTTSRNRVKITQSRKNRDYTKKLLEEIGFQYMIESVHKNCACDNYCIQDQQLWQYLAQFGKSHQKYIPQEFLMLDIPYLERLYHGYISGDSTVGHFGIELSSVSQKLVENLEELILKYKGILVRFHPQQGKKDVRPCYRGKFKEDGKLKFAHFGKPEKISRKERLYSLTLETANPMLLLSNNRLMWVANANQSFAAPLS